MIKILNYAKSNIDLGYEKYFYSIIKSYMVHADRLRLKSNFLSMVAVPKDW